LVDRCGAVVDDLAEARDHAACVVRSLTTARSLEDWRGWILHVNDDLGDELFVGPLFVRAGQAALKVGLFTIDYKRQQSGSPKV
jgi:sirohydrochlorin ferrochelatase